MRLVKIDGMDIIINMDRVVALKVHKCDNDHWDFYVNGNITGEFESTYEKNRVMQMIYEKFGTSNEKLHIDRCGHEVKDEEKELWV